MKTTLFDIERIRADFPCLQRKVNGKPLVYLDNAATSQKPIQVIKALEEYYSNYNANIHRAIHTLGEEATKAYEDARDKVARFINAKHREEVIFVRNTTEAINLVAYGWGRKNIQQDDRIFLSEMEHHSNIVPWQRLTQEKKAVLEYLPIDKDGLLDGESFEILSRPGGKLLALTHVSNVLGTINPVEEVVRGAHRQGLTILVDGAQSVPHMPVDVQKIGCDFLAFSAHKMLGPTGIGVLYGKREYLEEMDPMLGGGDMIREVGFHHARWNDLPWKFEAGTSNIADAIAFGVAIDYLTNIGMETIREHEKIITQYALEALAKVEGIDIYGPKDPSLRGGVISFNYADIHPHDLATILDEEGIAIRSGHHCAMPLHGKLGVAGSSRCSFYLYNTLREVDMLVEGFEKAKRVFRL